MDERTALHRDAIELLDALVGPLAAADLARATPCAGWSLADLLAHEVGQHLGFAAAVRHGDAPVAAYAPVPHSSETWAGATTELLRAFAEADPERSVVLRELSDRPLPFSVVVGAQLLDTVVHAWDVAAALGRDLVPPEPLEQAVAVVATALPAGASGDGAAFGAPLAGSGSRWEQTLRRVGRDPGWRAPAG